MLLRSSLVHSEFVCIINVHCVWALHTRVLTLNGTVCKLHRVGIERDGETVTSVLGQNGRGRTIWPTDVQRRLLHQTRRTGLHI